MRKTVVIGGGAAGMMAAINAAGNDNSVTVIEKNDRIGRKLMITGKGRCNVTNNCDTATLINNVAKNGRFLYSAFSRFSSADTMRFFENAGVPLKTERGNRVFPVSDRSSDIVDALLSESKKAGVRIEKGEAQEIIVKDGKACGVRLKDNRVFLCDSIILAAGGSSYPLTGSTGDGFRLAAACGHTVTKLCPSLVPLVCHEGFCSALAGLTLKNVTAEFFKEGSRKPVFKEMGELLFTHFGISGPVVLSASAHLRDTEKENCFVLIDLKPALDEQTLDKRLLRDFNEALNRDFSNSLGGLLPKSIIPVVIKLSGISPSLKVNQITKEQRRSLVSVIKCLRLNITGKRPIEEAVVTSGGVSVKEINPNTMESKIIEDLYFAGEVIDVDAYTGGFNLQIAFSTGFVAGTSAREKEKEI